MFYVQKTRLTCPTTDARICTYRDVYLVRDATTNAVVEATWDAADADATATLLNADDAHVLAAA